jgi:hypothetical protein
MGNVAICRLIYKTQLLSGPESNLVEELHNNYSSNPNGFSNDDIELLAEQGIKPWDEEASAALGVLYGNDYYDDYGSDDYDY